jgi:hypothetical protein
MESGYHIVTIRVNETSWAYVLRLRSHYLRMGYDIGAAWRAVMGINAGVGDLVQRIEDGEAQIGYSVAI